MSGSNAVRLASRLRHFGKRKSSPRPLGDVSVWKSSALRSVTELQSRQGFVHSSAVHTVQEYESIVDNMSFDGTLDKVIEMHQLGRIDSKNYGVDDSNDEWACIVRSACMGDIYETSPNYTE
eukprot:scaffold8827_cov37-Attheya_sp.AAC.1